MLGIDFAKAPSIDVDERYPEGMPAMEVSRYLARLKAEAYLPMLEPDDLYITADTTVIIDDEVIGKPADEAEAVAMLTRLSGRTHKVVTGVCVFTLDRMETFDVVTEVEFGEIDPADIEAYVREFRPLDKAGAYGIQERIGAIGVRSIIGSFYNVMGLPVHRLYAVLKSF